LFNKNGFDKFNKWEGAIVIPSALVCGCGQRERCQLIHWPVCKLDLILAILSILSSVAPCHLPYFNE